MERWPRDTKKLFFCLFLGWKYAKSKHMGLSYKSHFRHLILKVVVWLSGIASVQSETLRGAFGSNTVILLFFKMIFVWFARQVWVVCFLLNALLNISFVYWFCTWGSFKLNAMKFIHDLEDSFSEKMFTIKGKSSMFASRDVCISCVRKRGVICAVDFTYTRRLQDI